MYGLLCSKIDADKLTNSSCLICLVFNQPILGVKSSLWAITAMNEILMLGCYDSNKRFNQNSKTMCAQKGLRFSPIPTTHTIPRSFWDAPAFSSLGCHGFLWQHGHVWNGFSGLWNTPKKARNGQKQPPSFRSCCLLGSHQMVDYLGMAKHRAGGGFTSTIHTNRHTTSYKYIHLLCVSIIISIYNMSSHRK